MIPQKIEINKTAKIIEQPVTSEGKAEILHDRPFTIRLITGGYVGPAGGPNNIGDSILDVALDNASHLPAQAGSLAKARHFRIRLGRA